MKKRYILPLVMMLSVVCLNACGTKKTYVNETKKVSETKSVKKKEIKAETVPETQNLMGEAALKEALRERLNSFMGIKGTSGASLKTLHQAVRMLQLANEGNYTLSIVSPVTLEFYESLSDIDKAGFLETWGGVDYYTDTILYDFYSISNKLEDAGDLDAAKQLVNSARIKEKWEMMRKGIEGVLPDASETDADGETTGETDADGNAVIDIVGESESGETDETEAVVSEGLQTDENLLRSILETMSIPETTTAAIVPPVTESIAETTAPVATAPMITTPVATAPVTTEAQTSAYSVTSAPTETFTNVVLITVDEKLDPSELNYLRTKYNLRLVYDYPNFNMYAMALTDATTQAQMDAAMAMISSENHVTSVVQDRSAQLH